MATYHITLRDRETPGRRPGAAPSPSVGARLSTDRYRCPEAPGPARDTVRVPSPQGGAPLPKAEILSCASAVALAGPKQVPNRTRGTGSRASFRPAIMRAPGLGFEGPIMPYRLLKLAEARW